MPENNEVLRQLMAVTITDTKFLQGLKTIWDETTAALAPTAWRWLAVACLKYLAEYGVAPGRNIETLLVGANLDPEDYGDLEQLLAGLSKEWEAASIGEQNPDLLLKQAEKYFNRELYLRQAVRMEAAAEVGDLEAAEDARAEAQPVRIAVITATNPFRVTPEQVEEDFKDDDTAIVQLGQAYHELVAPCIIPDSFTVYMGGEKVGKTWTQHDLMFAGLKARENILMVQAGDLSLKHFRRRTAIALTGRNNRGRHCRALLMPVPDCKLNQKGECGRPECPAAINIVTEPDGKPYPELMKYEEATAEGYRPCAARCRDWQPTSWWGPLPEVTPLTWQDAYGAYRRYDRAMGDRLRLACEPVETVTIEWIDNLLHVLEDSQGWRATIVIIDYMDILRPERNAKSKDFRHQIDTTWKAARRLAQDWNCAVVSATQATKEGANRRLLRPKDTSEDKRKAAHVTAMFGLNADDHDKAKGWLRVNPLFLREEPADTRNQVAVLRLLARGRANLGSFWWNKISDD